MQCFEDFFCDKISPNTLETLICRYKTAKDLRKVQAVVGQTSAAYVSRVSKCGKIHPAAAQCRKKSDEAAHLASKKLFMLSKMKFVRWK